MKAKFITILTIAGSLMCAACTGNHSASSGRDTSEQTFGPPRQDTSTTPRSSDPTSVDNSGSGGTKITKDTAKKAPEKKP
jgi:hypothetical protein